MLSLIDSTPSLTRSSVRPLSLLLPSPCAFWCQSDREGFLRKLKYYLDRPLALRRVAVSYELVQSTTEACDGVLGHCRYPPSDACILLFSALLFDRFLLAYLPACLPACLPHGWHKKSLLLLANIYTHTRIRNQTFGTITVFDSTMNQDCRLPPLPRAPPRRLPGGLAAPLCARA